MTDLASSTNTRNTVVARPVRTVQPTTVGQPPASTGTEGSGHGPRWFGPVAVAVAAFAVVTTALVVDATSSSSPDESPVVNGLPQHIVDLEASMSSPVVAGGFTTAQDMIQESIDAALAEQSAVGLRETGVAQRMIQESIDAALAEQSTVAGGFTTAQEMIQESIDAALAEQAFVGGGYTTAQDLIQGEIDAALAELAQDDSYATAEANRMTTIREVLG